MLMRDSFSTNTPENWLVMQTGVINNLLDDYEQQMDESEIIPRALGNVC